jgi:hypothetical protein
MLTKLAKMFASLKKGIQTFDSVTSFPFVKSFYNGSNTKLSFEYSGNIKGLTFSAKALHNESDIVVKFCSRYNLEVHQYCHSFGFSPALYAIEKAQITLLFIIMEKLDLRPISSEDLLSESTITQIKFILQKLREKLCT